MLTRLFGLLGLVLFAVLVVLIAVDLGYRFGGFGCWPSPSRS